MFWKKEKHEEENLYDAQIEYIMDMLDKQKDPLSKDYGELLGRVEKLQELRAGDAKPERRKLSPDTILMACVNVAGIVAVLGYEHGHTITSKAFSMISKPKL